MKSIHILPILSLFSIVAVLFAADLHPGNSASSIIEYLKEQDDNFQVKYRRAILVLGDFNSGKSILTSLITGAHLESIEVGGSFHIVGKNDLTSEQTNIPHLMIDQQSGVVFYDCTPFSDSRDVKKDLARAFTIRKLLNFAESVKFLFTISYASIQEPIDDRSNFLYLIRNASHLIRNIKEYRDGIALIVTNTPNNENYAGNIESIVNYLQEIKSYFKNHKIGKAVDDEKQTIERGIQFIDILLEKNRNEYIRIGMMSVPNRSGVLSEMPLLQKEKANISKIISENLVYIQRENNEFGYTISESSKPYIESIIELLRQKLIDNFSSIGSDIKRFILEKEKYSANSLNESINTISMINQKLSQIFSMEPKLFAKQLINFTDTLTINLSIRSVNKFLKYIEFIDFLRLFNKNNLGIPIVILNQITNHKNYLKNSLWWYNFLIIVREKLSEYSIQKQTNNFDGSRLMTLAISSENSERTVGDLDIKSTIDLIDPQIFSTIKHLHINAFKLKLLQSIWDQSMQPISIDCSTDGKFLIAKGFNVLIRDIIESDCWTNAMHIEIFALNKVFLDANIDKPSAYLSIISPAWEIVLKSGIQIELSGPNAINYTVPAKSGENIVEWEVIGNDGENYSPLMNTAKNGVPGMPGGPGGQFFGIGESINHNWLEINLNGGRGGNGQDGGNGMRKTILLKVN